MRIGKLDNDELNELILSKFAKLRDEVVVSPRVGIDCAAVDMGGALCVLSTDPITSATEHIGALTVHVNCNDAAAAGAEPIGLLVTLLVPPSATKEDVARVADELSAAAREVNVEIIGGHTEVTASVNRMVTCATVVARAGRNGLVLPSGMREGDDLVLTKWAGLEGTSVIASDFAHRLPDFSEEELARARGFVGRISVLKEGLFAASFGAHAMHDVTEGGVLGAAWEMAQASGCGLTVYPERVPVHPLTAKLCAALGLDPLRLLSSGAMLIACENGEALAEGLAGIGVEAAVIGKAGGIGARLSDGTPLEAPGADELYRL
ncbi:MAG: Hydrogenase expression/formation protein HypE [Firmicutes bacterium ADurb.Bin248]|jgi:hydrogenase maturation factor|nr:MAG: Hydrogenase expression/formation protein HypE [Firmicutes bacterium ADurb.Bin248]HOG01106.1 AIR synthase family protein [Clostridia bacterium]HPK15686.1 AIR synthase family protein [Clostridia bacterium]